MLVSLKWLKDLVDVDVPVPELVDRLDLTGTAVEAVGIAGEALEGVIVGQVVSKERHPEADRLWITSVDVGDTEPLQIVCGAQNFEAGDKVPVARVGTTLPNGLTIKRAKLRGVESEGMNCSPEELGLGGEHAGLLILPSDAPVGMPFAEYRGLADTVLELEITPNRPDCMSMVGVAREVGAVLDKPASIPASSPAETGDPIGDFADVTIADGALCHRYTARLIRNVRIGPSPEWLAERVQAAGTRSINNIVDITNYVMFELGQPLHAFDADLLARDANGRVAIDVRSAQAGEELRTLDGQDRNLASDALLITDSSGPIALAGVMGGESTEVREETVNILLESASFSTSSVSRTCRRLGLLSEASVRFERGVDPAGCAAALDRAAALMAELAGGDVAPGIIDTYPLPAGPRELTLRLPRLAVVLGEEIPAEEATGILERLGCRVSREGSGTAEPLRVTVPTFRPDLEREIDLVEEVLRIHGMERIAPTLPAGRGRVGGLSREQRWRDRIGVTLRACGLNETMTYSFADPGDTERLRHRLPENEVACELLNPISVEQSVLRQMLLPGLLRGVSYNQRRGMGDVHLYEIGSVFAAASGRKQPKERAMVGAVLAGAWRSPAWNEPAAELGFFDGKGVLETLAHELGLERFEVRAVEIPFLQPGRSAEVLLGGQVIGWLGEVHPLVAQAFEASVPVTALEVQLAPLIREAKDVKPFTDVPKYPSVDHDLALVVDDDVTAQRLEQAIRSAGGKLLESVRVFDVYKGESVPSGKKSIALSLTYRASDRTLTAEEVDAAHERLVRKVVGAVGAEQRR